MMDDGKKSSWPAGTARLKSEYIVHDHVRELNLNYVANKDKKQINNDNTETDEEPPRKKLKGQNRKRPRGNRTPKSEKLCFKLSLENSCPYGDTCCYSHDISSYLANKLPDIGESCYLYETFGKCTYSLSCRFASKHLKEGKNIVSDKWEIFKDKKLCVNSLEKDVQLSLRKRNYNFEKSNEILKHIKCLNKTSETEKIEPSNFPKLVGAVIAEEAMPLQPRELKKVEFRDKLYLAPLTTVGNLPFRRICKEFGADVTCSEMAVALSLLQGQQSEWALLKRHHTEDIFGIQLCGAHPDIMTRCSQLLSETTSFDFIDLNLGCPLNTIYQKGAGCGLMNRLKKLEGIVYGVSSVISTPLTIKMRTGIYANENLAHNVIEKIHHWKDRVSLITLHGRSREQRYTKSANWEYIETCNNVADPIPLFGNGDILSYEDYILRQKQSGVAGVLIARGALIKPWIFKEIKEQKHWDISSAERLDILKKFTNYGLEHWGSDTEGIERTRRFLLEWLSFLYRYIPLGLLECPPQSINERPPKYIGRNDLETLMASPSCSDWIKIR